MKDAKTMTQPQPPSGGLMLVMLSVSPSSLIGLRGGFSWPSGCGITTEERLGRVGSRWSVMVAVGWGGLGGAALIT